MKRIILIASLAILCNSIYTSTITAAEITSLKEVQVKKISLRYDTLLMIPGTRHEIGLVVFTSDNHIYRTTGFLDGRLRWKNFEVEADGATFSLGKISITRSDSAFYKSGIPVRFYSVYEPDKVFTDTIRMDYMTEIKLFPTNKFRAIPGDDVEFGMEIFYQNGIRQTYKSLSKIDHFEDDFDVKVRSSRFKKSEFYIFDDPAEIVNHKSGVMVQSKWNPQIYDILEVLLDYRAQYRYSGSGMWGMNGFWGSSGSSGGMGEHGRPGQDGEPGKPGDYGHDLDVYVDAYQDTILHTTLIKVNIFDVNTRKSKRFMINPDGGSLYVSARGGDGGNGGDGGRGGNGGTGRVGATYTEEVKEIIVVKDTSGRAIQKEITKTVTRQRPGEEGGRGGEGGWGGPGGPGGNGGYVIVYFTPTSEPYLKYLDIDTRGGDGGRGGIGGAGGEGGAGGSGNPYGRKGRDGRNGVNAPYGYQGISGPVDYRGIDNIPW